MNVIRVMIVNNHTLFRQGLKKIIEEDPEIELVGEATTGDEAVVKARKLKPDIILMDVNLPGKNGAEAARAIKSENPRVEVIAVTSHNNRDYLLEMVKAGAIGYILEDVGSEELIKAIHFGYSGQSILHPKVATRLIEELASFMQKMNGLDVLTAREQEILPLIARGMTNKEIAKKLFISDKTVRNHVSNILRKLKLKDRTQAAIYAIKIGLAKLD